MEQDAVRRLDVQSLLKRTKVETTEEVIVATPKEQSTPKPVCINAELDEIDEATKVLSNPPANLSKTAVSESGIREILDKYNAKYNLNLEYSTLNDALDLAVMADQNKGEIANAIVNNSIVAVVDFTMFSLTILACKQINGLVTEMLEGDELPPDQKVVLLDRIFLWINRLQATKAQYSSIDLDHLVKKFQRKAATSGVSQNLVNKLISLLKLDKPGG